MVHRLGIYIHEAAIRYLCCASWVSISSFPDLAANLAVELILMAQKMIPSAAEELSFAVPSAKLWTPENPHLYDLQLDLLDGDVVSDTVESYVGIRTVGKQRDAAGHLRMTVNGEMCFHLGPLDQGWWPDGLLTAPSDEAMRSDVEFLKQAGFNMIRKHVKLEPRRRPVS